MKHIKIFAALVAVSLMGLSCKSQYELILEGTDVDAKYELAFDMFNQGKYSKAAQLFENLSISTSGTERDDTVQYYWGLSNYRFKDFYTAETNFQNFMEKFPRSTFTENASFLRVDCLYKQSLRYELDQSPSTKCIAAIGEYLTDFPLTPHLDICQSMLDDLAQRLDQKAYESAKLYYKMEDYQAARVALKNVLKDDADNMYREEILYYTAMSSYKFAHLSIASKQKERYLAFTDDYLNFVGEYPESKYRREMDALNKRAQKALGKNVADDEDDKTSAKAFEKERKSGEGK